MLTSDVNEIQSLSYKNMIEITAGKDVFGSQPPLRSLCLRQYHGQYTFLQYNCVVFRHKKYGLGLVSEKIFLKYVLFCWLKSIVDRNNMYPMYPS